MLANLYHNFFLSTLLLCFILRTFATSNVGIQQDWFEGHDSLLSFSAVMVYNANPDGSSPVPSITDGQMVGLAAKAYAEMITIWTAIPNKADNKPPGAMAVLAINNEIYFASVIKADRENWLGIGHDDGGKPQALVNAAGGCRIGGSSHRIGGRCGEINLMDTYYTRNQNLNFQGTGSRLVVWGTWDSGNVPLQILPPCIDNAGRYGCYTFLRAIANPQNPKQPLNDADLKVIAKTTALDNGYPNGLNSVTRFARLSAEDKALLCAIADDPYDPDHPELRKRKAMSIDAVAWK